MGRNVALCPAAPAYCSCHLLFFVWLIALANAGGELAGVL